jgi:C4-dicarboxylate-specific signal transduction histidine kinase
MLLQPEPVPMLLNDRCRKAISKFHGFGEIVVKTRTSGDQVEIIISDDGPGIAKKPYQEFLTPSSPPKGRG